jgi:hypothetical protein
MMQQEFYLSCANGFTDLVRKLLADDRVDPAEGDSHALYLAARYGNASVVQVLLADPRVDPTTFRNSAFLRATTEGHVEVVRVLLADSRIDPSSENNAAVRVAAREGYTEIIRLLLADNRVNALGAIEVATRDSARLLAEDERFGIEQQRDLYVYNHPALVKQFDFITAQGYATAFVAKQQNTWVDVVEPVAKRLKAGFICE